MDEINNIQLVILAAGRSKRMGSPKGLLRFENTIWIKHLLTEYSRIGFQQIVVVLGFDAKKYIAAMVPPRSMVKNELNINNSNVLFNINPTPERGHFSSIQTGLKSFPCKHTFIVPIDQPCPDIAVWSALTKSMSSLTDPAFAPAHLVSIPTFNRIGGHPILLSPKFSSIIKDWPLHQTNARMDLIIKNLPHHQKKRIAVSDDSILKNLNTPLLWQQYTANQKSNPTQPHVNGCS